MMIRTQIYLPEDLYREVKLLANTRRTNFSTLIREGVRLMVKKKTSKKRKSDPWKNIIGIAKGGPKTNAVKLIDDYYKNDVV